MIQTPSERPVRSRASVPGPGSSVSAATEARAVFVRQAVSLLRQRLPESSELKLRTDALLGSRWNLGTLTMRVSARDIASWALVSIRLVGRLTGALSSDATLQDAERWFIGRTETRLLLADLINDPPGRPVVDQLEAVGYDDNLRDLLPYVLDHHGPGSRASVIRDASTSEARYAKRAAGAFYTPADVAEYISRTALMMFGGNIASSRILDPACGSGIFLKAALAYAKSRDPNLDGAAFATRCLYGIDIDPLAVNAACFVLLHECIQGSGSIGSSPWSLWHQLRLNIVPADALRLASAAALQAEGTLRTALREALATGYLPPTPPLSTKGSIGGLFAEEHGLPEVLPELSAGADVIIGNPPYASVGRRHDLAALRQRFASCPDGCNAATLDLFPLFVELMWRLARPGRSAAGMVVPLAIAYHSGPQMRECRRALAGAGGKLQFAFFDREPHALFGEDVKTRNAIVFRIESGDLPARGDPAIVETGPLRKWTSRTRENLFASISFTQLEASRITDGIPKLAGPAQSHVHACLMRDIRRSRQLWQRSFACLPEAALSQPDRPMVYVASTAYNFLNVFRPHRSTPLSTVPWSQNPLHALECADESTAACVFAILSSRIVYWLWHATGDGFHVPRSFIEQLPFDGECFALTERDELAQLGAVFWDKLQTAQVVSVNGGRMTIAYRPHASDAWRDQVDAALLRKLRVSDGFVQELRTFVRQVVAVDHHDSRRRRYLDQFGDEEGTA